VCLADAVALCLQLLDYVHSEVEQGRDHKGILVGNGYRDVAPYAAEREKSIYGESGSWGQYNWDKPALFISPAFVVFLDLFKMFAAIPSHQFAIMGAVVVPPRCKLVKPLYSIQGLFEFCVVEPYRSNQILGLRNAAC